MSMPFEGMDERSRVFYTRVFGHCMLNIHAVRLGFYDTLLCDTDDPRQAIRWHEAVRRLAPMIYQRLAEERDGS